MIFHSSYHRALPLLFATLLTMVAPLLFAQQEAAPKAVTPTEGQDLRLISAGAGITELVLALEGEQQLVGVDSSSQLPERLGEVAQVGYHRMLSTEGLLSLQPDLLLGTHAMGPEKTLSLLNTAGVEVIRLPSATDQTSLISNIDVISRLLGKQDQAYALKQRLAKQFNQISHNRTQLASMQQPVKVLFILLQAGRAAKVGGEDTAADILIRLAGGVNAAPFAGYKAVSQEGVLALQPDLILISSRDETTIAANSRQALVSAMPLLASSDAYKAHRIDSLAPQALIGGLGLTAVNQTEKLSEQLLITAKSTAKSKAANE